MKDKEFLTEKERREKDFAEETWVLAIFFFNCRYSFLWHKTKYGITDGCIFC